jgi:Flp pilus assembly secretin CpaC
VLQEKEPSKAAHLRYAARHLTAAGKTKLAQEVLKEALLEQKLEQIRKLQTEVAEVRDTMPAEQTVILQIKVMELQVARMRKLGFDFETVDKLPLPDLEGKNAAEFEKIPGLLSALRQHKLVKVLAEPTLATFSGRPARFQSGGEFPITVPQSEGKVAVEYRHFGTQMDCLATVLENGRIRIELRAEFSEIDNSRSVTVNDTSIPGLRTRSVDTAAEMKAGQTLLLTGAPQRSSPGGDDPPSSDETCLLVTIAADLGEPVAHAQDQAEHKRR